MPLDPKRAISELKELRELTSDNDGAQRVAWTDTWLKARGWFEVHTLLATMQRGVTLRARTLPIRIRRQRKRATKTA